jgi:hypothetical protein
LKETQAQAAQAPDIEAALAGLKLKKRFVGVSLPTAIAADINNHVPNNVQYSVVKEGGQAILRTAPALTAQPKTMAVTRSITVEPNAFGGKDLRFGDDDVVGAQWLKNKTLDAVLPKGDARRKLLEDRGIDLTTPRDFLVVAAAGDKEPTLVFDLPMFPQTNGLRMAVRPTPHIVSVCSDITCDSLSASGGGGGGITIKKPVVYLYPTSIMDVSVMVKVDGEFTTCYPKMSANDTWNVKAGPTGEIFDPRTEKRFPYLFWEADRRTPMTIDASKAHCVSKNDAEMFLENAAKAYCLNDKERTDFVTFWLPAMERNAFNMVQFLSDAEYNQYAEMTVTPKPDNVIRMFMVFQGMKSAVKTGTTAFASMSRGTGFTVVEWGGTNLDETV